MENYGHFGVFKDRDRDQMKQVSQPTYNSFTDDSLPVPSLRFFELYSTEHMFDHPMMTELNTISHSSHSSPSSSEGDDCDDFSLFTKRKRVIKKKKGSCISKKEDGEHYHHLKFCQNCRKLFTSPENVEGSCRYHHGKYQASKHAAFTVSMKLKRWTCCKNEGISCPGCITGVHKECRKVGKILSNFRPVQGEELERPSLHTSQHETLSPSRKQSGKEEDTRTSSRGKRNHVPKQRKRDGEIEHLVTSADTLQGIAIRYGVSPADIKRRNPSGDILLVDSLIVIPSSKP